MSLREVRIGLLGVVALSLGAGAAAAQAPSGEKKQPTDSAPASAQEEAKPAEGQLTEEEWAAMAAYGQPGEAHKVYEGLVGKWNLKVRTSLGAEGDWTESKGTAEYKWMMGGRFLMEQASCNFEGMTFEWVGLLGYNNHTKEYTAVWVDNASTDTENARGQYDATTRSIDFQGEQFHPRYGRATKFRWVMRLSSPERFVIEMYAPNDQGKDEKQMEIQGVKAP